MRKTFITIALLPLLACAQSSPGPWSGAEFVRRTETDIIMLNRMKSWTPFTSPGLKQFSLDFDSFGGYNVANSTPVTGLALLGTLHLGRIGLSAGIGDEVDLSSKFRFTDLTVARAGLVIAGSYSF